MTMLEYTAIELAKAYGQHGLLSRQFRRALRDLLFEATHRSPRAGVWRGAADVLDRQDRVVAAINEERKERAEWRARIEANYRREREFDRVFADFAKQRRFGDP